MMLSSSRSCVCVGEEEGTEDVEVEFVLFFIVCDSIGVEGE